VCADSGFVFLPRPRLWVMLPACANMSQGPLPRSVRSFAIRQRSAPAPLCTTAPHSRYCCSSKQHAASNLSSVQQAGTPFAILDPHLCLQSLQRLPAPDVEFHHGRGASFQSPIQFDLIIMACKKHTRLNMRASAPIAPIALPLTTLVATCTMYVW
jgi:hypothetical protein